MGNIGWKKGLGIENVEQYIDFAFVTNGKDLPIVSVGSGDAETEYAFERRHHKKIICVDPDPKSFNKGITYIEPEYSYVDDLIQNQPELVGNCHLLLIWPLPNRSEYDVDAIEKLNPLSFVIVYEPSGGSGGRKLLYSFLPSQNLYECVSELTIPYEVKSNCFYNTISYYTRKDYKVDFDSSKNLIEIER